MKVGGRGHRADTARWRATGDVGRGHYRIQAGQRPARPRVSRRVEVHGHRQHDVPGRITAGGVRRARHGAPAGTHGVQGQHPAPQHPAGADGARRQAQWQHLVRPHELFRDVSGDRREPEMGAGSGSRPDGEFLHQEVGSRERVHGRAQRVRGRREQPDRGSGARRVVRGVCLAPVWPGRHREPRRHRERADR